METSPSGQKDGSNVRVAMRVRPRTAKEIEVGAQEIITVQGNGCTIMDPTAFVAVEAVGRNGKGLDMSSFTRTFHFDECYWSANLHDPHYASQERVYDDLGISVLENAWEGYNCSIFAYGQTGAGKSYTMMGTGTALDDRVGTQDYGLIPRVCCGLFGAIEQVYNEGEGETNMHYSVEVSYMEIYKEVVRDLFNPRSKSLKVREHPKTGAYVEDLCMVAVNNYQEIGQLIAYGGQTRTVASTNMNQYSSRSHAIFTIVFRQTKVNLETNSAVEKISRINMVDLAGSERVNLTGSTGERLKEANSINRSLANLSDVIKALASAHKKSKPQKEQFIPYRNSVLTWLLKESLGGNAKTIMVAAISPCDVHFEETLSTLRYAERAKRVRNHAVVNQDSSEKLIDQLKAEISLLRGQLAARNNENGSPNDSNSPYGQESQWGNSNLEMQLQMLQKELQEKEQLIQQLTSPDENKGSAERSGLLKQMGMALPGDKIDESAPRLINLNQDPLFSECLIYYLKEGINSVGCAEDVTIQLSGEDMAPQHCVITHTHGLLMLCPLSPEALCFVNGEKIGWNAEENQATPVLLTHKSRVVFGRHHFFRCEHPSNDGGMNYRRLSTDSLSKEPVVDWEFAQKELVEKSGLPSVFGVNAFPQLLDLEEKVRKLEAERQAYKMQLESRIDELSDSRSSVRSFTETGGNRWRPFLVGGSDSETASFHGNIQTLPKYIGGEVPSGAESDTSSTSTAYRDMESYKMRAEQRKARLRHRQVRSLQMKQRRASGSGGGGASLGCYSGTGKTWTISEDEGFYRSRAASHEMVGESAFQSSLHNQQHASRMDSSAEGNFERKAWPQDNQAFLQPTAALSPPLSPSHHQYHPQVGGSPSISDLSFNSGPSVRASYNSNVGQSLNSVAPSETSVGEIDVLYNQLSDAQSRIDILERDLKSIVRLASGNNLRNLDQQEGGKDGKAVQGMKQPLRSSSQHNSAVSDREAARARSVQRQRARTSKMLKAESDKQKALVQKQLNS